jgi:hypothetical protein
VYVFDHHQVKLQLLHTHTYTQSSSLHTTGAKLQKRILSLSLSCSQHYRCYCLYFYILYYYYFFSTLSLSPFLFHSDRVVVLATTTTGFSFSFFLLPFLSLYSFFLSMLALFPISKHTALLTGCCKKEHDDERTFRVIVRKERKREKQEGYRGVLFPIQRPDRSDALFLCDYSIRGTGPISLFSSYLLLSSLLFRTGHKQATFIC